jgi:hypothetical protein
VSGWSEIFLGVIAVATLAIAVVQIGVLVAATRLVARIARLMDDLDREMKPIFGHLNAIGRDASRAASLATAQVERLDRALTDLGTRLEQTLRSLQATLNGPAREGWAAATALFAALRAMRNARGRRRRADEDDALFI